MNKHLELFAGSANLAPSANAGYSQVGANENGSVVYKKQP